MKIGQVQYFFVAHKIYTFTNYEKTKNIRRFMLRNKSRIKKRKKYMGSNKSVNEVGLLYTQLHAENPLTR